MRKFLLGSMLLGLLPCMASAADFSSPDHSGIYIGPVLDVGYDYGGDKVATIEYSDGSHSDIKSGQGYSIAGGGHIRLYQDSPFDLRVTVGVKSDSRESRHADISLDRVSYELTPSVRLPYGVWAGIGVVEQTNIKFDADGYGPDLKFKDATGANFELGWRSRTYRFVDGGVALVYTAIKYRDEMGNHYNSDSIGIRFTANFGWTVFRRQRPVTQEASAEIVNPPSQ